MLRVQKPTQKRKLFGNVPQMYKSALDGCNLFSILMPKINFRKRKVEFDEVCLTEHLLDERCVHFLFFETNDESLHRSTFQNRKIQNI